MNRGLLATVLIVSAVAACNSGAASSPAATATPTLATASPTSAARSQRATHMPAEVVTAFCDYVSGYLAITKDDDTLDALVAARDGEPGDWVRWAGPALIVTAEGLGQRLGDIVWWGQAGTPAPRTAFKSLQAWTTALDASLKDPMVRARYELIWKTWFDYTQDHLDFLRDAGTLKGACA